MLRSLTVLAIVMQLFASQALAARVVNILVADKKSPAYKNAKAMADDKETFAERKLHKAFSQAEEIIKACPACPPPRVRGMKPPPCDIPADTFCEVNIKVAHGDYKGKGGRGNFSMPELIAPETTLRILGGYDDQFKTRAPFKTPSTINLAGTVFKFNGKNHALKELYISGFAMDIGDGNEYDSKANVLLKGSSGGVQHITIGYLTTERLVFADNVFLNSSHKAAAPLIRAKGDDAEVIIRNNFILNNVLAWEADSARFKTIPARYVVEGNSFIMNWPYNPDPTTANPAALQFGGKYSAKKMIIKKNLFAHNMGGALFHIGTSEKSGPETEIKENLFFNNGGLFEEKEPGASAMVVKFGGFKSKDFPWNTIDVETLEDDYEWDSEDNVAFDPKVPIHMVKPGFANSNDVHAQKTKLNDVRGLLGLAKKGNKLVVKNYAPRMAIDFSNPPFPAEPKAKKYGVDPARVEQF